MRIRLLYTYNHRKVLHHSFLNPYTTRVVAYLTLTWQPIITQTVFAVGGTVDIRKRIVCLLRVVTSSYLLLVVDTATVSSPTLATHAVKWRQLSFTRRLLVSSSRGDCVSLSSQQSLNPIGDYSRHWVTVYWTESFPSSCQPEICICLILLRLCLHFIFACFTLSKCYHLYQPHCSSGYCMGQITKSCHLCLSVCLSVCCPRSHGRNFDPIWSNFTGLSPFHDFCAFRCVSHCMLLLTCISQLAVLGSN